MPLAVDEAFVKANQGEAALWILIALAFGWYAIRQTGEDRRRCLIALVGFFAFGISDLVETHTGAWWRPWWLFAWKACCVAAMAGLLVDDSLRRRRKRKREEVRPLE